MNVVTGTYTGDGGLSRLSLDFVPSLVIVWGDTTEEVLWRNPTCWHGRTQSLYDNNSVHAIGPYYGNPWQPLRGLGFSVVGIANTSGVTYHYIAAEDINIESTSFIGNALAARALDFTSGTPAVGFVKRDSTQTGQWRVSGSASAVASTYQGGTNAHVALTATGFTLSADNSVNQNNNAKLGEGIEAVAFFEGEGFELVTWTGSGTTGLVQALGVSDAKAAILLDLTNDAVAATDYHCIISDTMDAGDTKPLAPLAHQTGVVASLTGTTITFSGANFNETGRTYAALVFREVSSAYSTVQPTLSGAGSSIVPTLGSGHVALADTTLSGACSLEWYGRPRFTETLPPTTTTGPLVPLMLLGNGTSLGTIADAGTYNGGLFLDSFDRDSNRWAGQTIRFVQTDYMSRYNAENSFNYHSINTGITVRSGDDLHLMLTHNGSGLWRLYQSGKLVKEHNVNLDQATYGNRTNGGSGSSLATTLGALLNSTYSNQSDTAHYRASIWTSALTDAQVLSRANNAISGSAYSGTAPSVEYDFRTNGSASGATGTATDVVARSLNVADSALATRFKGSSANLAGNATQTFTGAIPSAGKWLVSAVAWTNGITSVTASGVAATPLGADERFSTSLTSQFFYVETTAAGNVVATLANATPAAAMCAVWDASGLDPDTHASVSVDTQSRGTPVTLSDVSAGWNCFAIGLKAGGIRIDPLYMGGDLLTDQSQFVGSTSGMSIGSITSPGGNITASPYYGDASNAGSITHLIAIAPLTPSSTLRRWKNFIGLGMGTGL